MNNKRKLLEIVALVLGAIGLGETNFIVNSLYWMVFPNVWNWIDVQFWIPEFKVFYWVIWSSFKVVWQVSLINCIIIFWSCLWFSWIFFVIASHWRTSKND